MKAVLTLTNRKALFQYVSFLVKKEYSFEEKKMIRRIFLNVKHYSTQPTFNIVNNEKYPIDQMTNITPKIISLMNRNLFKQPEHPIFMLRERIVQYFYKKFKGRTGNPIFSVHDNLNPVVTVQKNFDDLLVPKSHPSRSKTDCYYLNKDILLRAHMTAHQPELLRMGLNNFLMVGDVFRRDEIDSCHYPVFHQIDGVRTFTPEQLFHESDDGIVNLNIMEKEEFQRTKEKQEAFTARACQMVEKELKETLQDLTKELFGENIQYRWVEAFFPFTHPSWELEIFLNNNWLEMLGCGIMEHKIMDAVGCGNRIAWAFGLGLDRLAMLFYSIPDIRIFWSKDEGFLHQFAGKTWQDKVTFKPFSAHPPCPFDVSFWLKEDLKPSDFYELVREHCGDIVEQVKLIDSFTNPKTGRKSQCYRIIYRSFDKTLTKTALQDITNEIRQKLVNKFGVELRV